MKRNVDMINGSMPLNMIRFVIPIILTGVLQLLFNACDLIVVGQFAGDTSLAAVGATGALINLLVNAFIGLSVGVNVLAAQAYGARDHEKAEKILHTAILLSLVCGAIVSVAGIFLARPCLSLMNTPEDVLDLAVLYMQIYFLGVPASLVYNFGAAILRAQGNSKHPLMFLTTAGVVNVVLNLILVVVFNRSVDGVAAATAISQVVSAVLVILYLRDPSNPGSLQFRKLRIDKDLIKKIFRIGIPAGVSSMVFSFSNIQIQSSVNLFGSSAMAGCAAAANIEGFIYTSMNAVHQGAMNFTGQNVGSGKKERVPKILGLHLIFVTIIGLALGALALLLKKPLLSLYITDQAAFDAAYIRMNIIALTYFLCGYMEVFVGVLRGMGYSIVPTVTSMLGACGLRLLWIATVFRVYTSLEVLYVSYPVTWAITTLAHFVCLMVVLKKHEVKLVAKAD